MAINFNQSSTGMLLQLINQDNASTLTQADVSFGVPSPYAGTAGRDTQVTATAKAGRPYSGSFTFHYKRLDLGTTWATGIQFTTGTSYTNTHSILSLINTQYNLQLDTSDITNTVFTGGVATLTASPQSLVWKGTVTITLNAPTVALSTIFSVADLNGFVYPTF